MTLSRESKPVRRSEVSAWRWAAAVIFLLMALIAVGWGATQRNSYRKSTVPPRTLNEATMQAVELTVSESTTLYQIAVGLAVALWVWWWWAKAAALVGKTPKL